MVSLFYVADKLSDGINPILCVLALEEPLLNQGGDREPWPLFWVRTIVATGLAVSLAELGKHHQIWHGHGNFPSGHTTFATAVAASLVLRRGPRWLWLSVPLVVVMASSLIYGHWHTPDEVIGGFVLGLVITTVCFRLFRSPKRQKIRL